MSHLVQILLPVSHTRRSRTNLDAIRDELTEEFGGATLHVDAPAEGIWDDGGEIERDRIVVVEVMTDDLDREWWASYRAALQVRFRQEEVVIRAAMIERL